MNSKPRLTPVTVKKTHKTAKVGKQEGSKKILAYVRRSVFISNTLFPNLMTIGKDLWM